MGVKRLPCQLNLSSFFNFNGNLISGVDARGLACLSALVFPGLFEVFAIVSDLFRLIGYFTHVERSCLSTFSIYIYMREPFFSYDILHFFPFLLDKALRLQTSKH